MKQGTIQKNNWLENCSFVKIILLIFVMFGHSIAYWAGDWFTGDSLYRPDWIQILFKWIGSFHVFGFVLVSGYIFGFKMDGGAYKSYKDFVKIKAKRLLIPYIFVAFAWVIPISTILLHWDFTYILKNFILCEGPSQLWFLWMLFGVFLIARWMWNIISARPLCGWFISLALYLIGSIGYKFVPNYFCIWNACQYFVVFYVGIRIWRESILTRLSWIIWLAADLIVFALYLYNPFSGRLGQMTRIGLPFLLHLTGAVMSFSILQEIAGKVDWKNQKWISQLYKMSMPMFLIHQQIIYISILIFNGRVPVSVNILMNFIIAFSLSYLIGNILVRYKYTRFLIGER